MKTKSAQEIFEAHNEQWIMAGAKGSVTEYVIAAIEEYHNQFQQPHSIKDKVYKCQVCQLQHHILPYKCICGSHSFNEDSITSDIITSVNTLPQSDQNTILDNKKELGQLLPVQSNDVEKAANSYIINKHIEFEDSNATFKGFIQDANWQSQQQEDKWIKISDRLPEKAQAVIVCKNNYFICGMYFNSVGFFYGNLDQTSQVTHWQPLPKIPTI